MMAVMANLAPARLWPWSVFAALIACAGLPIYIHAPKFYVDEYGVGLAALGAVLALLRLVDVVQDPFLGWLAEAGRGKRSLLVTGAVGVMMAAMLALFAVPPPVAPLAWFALSLACLFSAFSFLTIVFYAQGVARAKTLGPKGHLRLAGWRETGSLLGVSVAAVAPVALAAVTDQPFTAFALGFALLAVIAALAMRHEWEGAAKMAPAPVMPLFRRALADRVARRLLAIALVNAAPVAVTSTLFLFFVESRLGAPGWEGPLLLLFFLSAAASAPLWGRLAAQIGEKRSLMAAMALAIAAFLWAVLLQAGDMAAFAVICLASGAAMGADLTLLPALFARRLAQLGDGGEGAGFGLWSFVSKLALALAAAILLPALQWAGFTPGASNDAAALWALTLLYAALPCGLKLLALALVATTDLERV
ncbi:MFS transporter [Pseudotabrizicola sp. L79]|uniref:MFS transporter n=1 Tax=Pseudotabrizicola sp. L79 TaxID=3118402 RepID=UPI002F94FCC3